MASYPNLPIPGILKILSKIKEPPTVAGKILAKTVIMGIKEFLSTCFKTTVLSLRPLALAVLM